MRAVNTRFRVQWDGDGDEQVLACTCPITRTVQLRLPGRQQVTVDVVTARAVMMLLSHTVFGVLRPDGPYLHIEEPSGDGWISLREDR